MSLYVATGFSDLNVQNLFKIGVTVNIDRRLCEYHRHHSDVLFIATKGICENRTLRFKDEADRLLLTSNEREFLNIVRSSSDFTSYKGLYGVAREWFVGDVEKAVQLLHMFEPIPIPTLIPIRIQPPTSSKPIIDFFKEVRAILNDFRVIEYPSDETLVEDLDRYINDTGDDEWAWFKIPKICERYRITERSNPIHVALLLTMTNYLIRYSTEVDDISCESEVIMNMRFLGKHSNSVYQHMKQHTRTKFLDMLYKNIFRICDHLQDGSAFNLENQLQQLIFFHMFVDLHEGNKKHPVISDILENLENELLYDGDECDDDIRSMMYVMDTFSKRYINNKMLLILNEPNPRSCKRNLLEWIEYVHLLEIEE
jgi:hypothetical protein